MATAKKKQEERADKMADDSDDDIDNYRSLTSSFGDDSSDNNNILTSKDDVAMTSEHVMRSSASAPTMAPSHGYHQQQNADHMGNLHSNNLLMQGMLNNGLNVLQWRHGAPRSVEQHWRPLPVLPIHFRRDVGSFWWRNLFDCWPIYLTTHARCDIACVCVCVCVHECMHARSVSSLPTQ